MVYLVLATLLVVGLVPLVITGWIVSSRSAQEIRAVEERYQIGLVQDKARQIEIFVRRYADLVGNYSSALELNTDVAALTGAKNEEKLREILSDEPAILGLSVKPVRANEVSLFRSEVISQPEVTILSDEALSQLGDKKVVWSGPMQLRQTRDHALAIASPVTEENGDIVAALIAVISLGEFRGLMEQPFDKTEQQLWAEGLPIVFVTDGKGEPVFHPDKLIVEQQRSMQDMKIVAEWQEGGKGVQSALFPFEAEKYGEKKGLIGAYSTVHLDQNRELGVFAIQDENKALASVNEMREQMTFISIVCIGFVLLLGFLLSNRLTRPVLGLVDAARKIADGDYSTRIDDSSRTELGTLSESFNLMTDRLEDHIARLQTAANENRELFVGTVKALAAAIDGKDRYTRGHSERVARFSVAMAQRLGLPEEEVEKIRISALLHDVGKIAIDDHILKKPAALTDEEFEIMKQHPQRGYKIMSQIPAMKDFLPGMYMHHEMVNGRGYPQGLKDHEIPLQAKIVSVADTFDAMTTDRPYQKGMQLSEALERIQTFVGTRYDPKVVNALIEACRAGQVKAHSTSWHTNSADVPSVVPKTPLVGENSISI